MAKRITEISAFAAVMILMMLLFTATEIYAANDLELEKTSFDLDEPDELCWSFIRKKPGCIEDISTVTVSQPGVVYADPSPRAYDGGYRIQAIGKGDVTLTVTGDGGTTVPVSVHVGDKGLQLVMSELTFIKTVFYGEKKIGIEVIPGSNYELTIGDKKFTGATAVRDYDCTELWFDLDKVYDAGTKITLYTYNQGCSATITDKVIKDTWVERIKASGKTFSIKTFNLHKGDVVSIKYAGKTYSKKITSDKDRKSYTVKIKAKKKIAKNAKVTFTIKNKYKTKLQKKTVKLYKYTWDVDGV